MSRTLNVMIKEYCKCCNSNLETCVLDWSVTYNFGKLFAHLQIADIFFDFCNEACPYHLSDVLKRTERALIKLKANPENFQSFVVEGWGNISSATKLLSEFINICNKYPDANIYYGN